MHNLKRISAWHFLFFILFFIIACTITFPLIFNLGNVATGYSDELLIAWIQNWNIHKILGGPVGLSGIFNTNSYYPYLNTLAYSDTHFISSLISLVPIFSLKEPIVANNFTIIFSITFLGFFSYLLSSYITKNCFFSFLSGILVQFCPVVLDKIVHIQILAIYFLPIAIYFLLNFLSTKKFLHFLLFLLILLLQIYNSFMPGYFIIFSAFLIILFFILANKNNMRIIFSKKIIFSSVFTLLLIIPVILPYYEVSSEFKYTRDIRESIHLGLQPEDFLSTNSFSKFNNIFSSFSFNHCDHTNCEIKPGFVGSIFSLLSIFTIVYLFRNWKKQKYAIKGLLWTAILGLILSFGPFLHIARYTIHKPFPIPLPYTIAYYLLPGFNGFRNSARFEMMFIIPVAVLIAYVFTDMLKNVSRIKVFIIYFICCLGIIAEFNFPMKFYPVPKMKDFPKVYSWLNNTPKNTVLIEMPIFTWHMLPYVFNENWRLYYSTANYRNMINGASGFSPPPWRDSITKILIRFPSNNSIQELKKQGVNLIIVHKKEYDLLYKNDFTTENKKIDNGTTIINSLKDNNRVMLIRVLGDDYVFAIK
jgi:hypothetical protein